MFDPSAPGSWRGSRRRLLAGSAAVIAARHAPAGRHAVPTAGPSPAPLASPAPSWVTPGIRVSHDAATATITSGRYELVEDPAGTWVDPGTGKRYREVFTALPSNGAAPGGATGSGQGLWIVDVVAIDGADVVLSRSSYLDDPLNGVYLPGMSSGERVPAASVPTVWIEPATLAAMSSDAGGTRLVLDGPITVGETTYDARSLVDPTPGNYSFFAFDRATGVLLLSALRTNIEPAGGVQMSTTELRSVRQVSLPGLLSPLPQWVSVGKQLTYKGSQSFANPMSPQSPAIVMELSSDVTFTDIGATWAFYEMAMRMETMSEAPVTTGVSGGTGPFWWDPASLGAMEPGQVLDQDPETGLTLTVSHPVSGPSGAAIAITGTVRGIVTESRFDVATGVLLAQTQTVSSTGLTTQIGLQQMP